MKKQGIRRKIELYCCFGFLCMAAGWFLNSRPAFADQEFLIGCLCGAGIVLLLQGVYYIGKGLRGDTSEIEEK